MEFNYQIAFSRNLGWVTEAEFSKLRGFKIAIAGMGGVGGSHLMALVRMGFERFVIADFDHFEIHNFNRQYGADMNNLGKNKCEVMKRLALAVNPNCQIETFLDGVTSENIDEFLRDADLYVDGLDVFELTMRQMIFARARLIGLPCVTSAPLGFGASVLVFDEKSISFADYFQFIDGDHFTNVLKFVLGLAPSLMQVRSLVDRKFSNLAQKKTSSTPAGCFAASAIICTEAVKILLCRGIISRAPKVIHYDFYQQKMKHNWVPGGMRNPFMKIKLLILKTILSRLNENKKGL